jgi:hypothetical protein
MRMCILLRSEHALGMIDTVVREELFMNVTKAPFSHNHMPHQGYSKLCHRPMWKRSHKSKKIYNCVPSAGTEKMISSHQHKRSYSLLILSSAGVNHATSCKVMGLSPDEVDFFFFPPIYLMLPATL